MTKTKKNREIENHEKGKTLRNFKIAKLNRRGEVKKQVGRIRDEYKN